jgi:NAD(P)-dependent dehydrogenase (short-subunit alcohol dehydrogenase family)
VAKLLVIGASRGIGLETVKAALRAGQSVRALPRSAASIPIQDAGRATVARIMANHPRVVVLKLAFADGPVCSWPIAISASCSRVMLATTWATSASSSGGRQRMRFQANSK